MPSFNWICNLCGRENYGGDRHCACGQTKSTALAATPRKNIISAHVCDGSGWSPDIETNIGLEVLDDRLQLIVGDREIIVEYSKIVSIQVEGFVQKRNAGLTGGGFGTKAAIKGIYAAHLINTITTRTRKWVTVEIFANDGMVVLLLPNAEEVDIKKLFRKAQDSIVANSKKKKAHIEGTVVSELERLAALLEKGVLTKAEFLAAKEQLLKR